MKTINKGTATLFHSKGKPYTSISNKVVESIQNPDALAIWTFLQTKDNNWTVIASWLQKRFGIGRNRYAAAMKLLESMGLIEYHRIRCEKSGQIEGTRIVVNFEPATEMYENPHVGESTRRSVHKTGKQQLPIKDSIPTKDKTKSPEKSGSVEVEAKAPCQAIVDSYNQICAQLPQVRMTTSKRKQAIKTRITEDAARKSLRWWQEYFTYVAGIPFLCGANEREWKADFDWITNESNMARIIEGRYESE